MTDKATGMPRTYGISASYLDFILREQLKNLHSPTIIDFGAGEGKTGKIARSSLSQNTKIIAVEGFSDAAEYLKSENIYDVVENTLIGEWLNSNKTAYHTAVFGDVIEHLRPAEIHATIRKCMKCFDYIIIVAPLHNLFQQASPENPLDEHLSYITENFFMRYAPLEKHVYHGARYTILNVLIQSKVARRPFIYNLKTSIFHLIMVAAQPFGLCKPILAIYRLTKRMFTK